MNKLTAIQIKLTKENKKDMIKVTHDILALHEKSKLDDFLFSMALENVLTGLKQELGLRKILNVTKDKRIIDYDKYKRIAEIVEQMQLTDVNLLLFQDDPEVWFQYYLGLYLNKQTCIICEEKSFDKLKRLNNKFPIVKVPSFDDAEAVDKAVKSLMEMYDEDSRNYNA